MRSSYSRGAKNCLLLGLLWAASTTQAALQRFNYLSLNSPARDHHASAMAFANPQAPKGGVISFAAIGSFDNFNSMNGKGSAAEGLQLLYDSLLKKSLDEADVAYPLLAQSISYDPEQPNYVIFHLNPAAKFHDGSAVTAEDVVFSFQRFLDQGAIGLQLYLSGIAKVRALNRLDVRFDFKSQNFKELAMIVARTAIFSKKDLSHKDFRAITLQPPLGSGPYRLHSMVAGRRISYARHANYWGKNLAVNRGAYNFDRIDYRYYRSQEVAFEGFKIGQYTVQLETDPRRWQSEYQFNAMRQGWVKKIAYRHHNPIGSQSLVLNTRHSPLDDIHFRHALSYAYDFEWQNKALFNHQYRRLQSYFDNSPLAASGTPSSAELRLLKPYLKQLSALERYGVMIDWQYPVSDGTGFNRENLLTARRILLQSGYRFNQQGELLDKKGRPIRLELLLNQQQSLRSILPFQRHLKKIGIDLVIQQVDLPQYIQRTRQYDYDLIDNFMPQSVNPSTEQLSFWGSQAAKQVGNYNYAGVRNPVIDAILAQLILAKDRQQIIVLSKVLDRLLRAGYYQILGYGKPEEWYAVWDVYQQPKQLPKHNIGFEYWWYSPTKAQKLPADVLRQWLN